MMDRSFHQNGNILQDGLTGYDVATRISSANIAGGTARYSYAPGNKRIWRGTWSGSTQTVDELTYYSGSAKLTAYNLTVSGSNLRAASTGYYEFFGGKMIRNAGGYINSDRLGSIGKFFPYGQERPSATTNGKEEFATYFRDSETGLDYAQNRYHSSGDGRFTTPDPFGGSAHLTDPGSWNRYAYVGGDPINRNDPSGLDFDLCVDAPWACVYGQNMGNFGLQDSIGAAVTGAIQGASGSANVVTFTGNPGGGLGSLFSSIGNGLNAIGGFVGRILGSGGTNSTNQTLGLPRVTSNGVSRGVIAYNCSGGTCNDPATGGLIPDPSMNQGIQTVLGPLGFIVPIATSTVFGTTTSTGSTFTIGNASMVGFRVVVNPGESLNTATTIGEVSSAGTLWIACKKLASFLWLWRMRLQPARG